MDTTIRLLLHWSIFIETCPVLDWFETCCSCEMICWCKSAKIFFTCFAICFFVGTTGKIKINLTNQCHGRVNVCVNETCGGVCADTWTEQMSLMLCKNLGCGDKILRLQKKHEISNVIIQSLHTTQHTTKVNQCNLVRRAENDEACKNNAAYVACSGNGLFEKYLYVQKHICKNLKIWSQWDSNLFAR